MLNFVNYRNKNNVKVLDIAAGSNHILLLDSSSFVWGWGLQQSGCLGQESYQQSTYKTIVPVFFGSKQYCSITAIANGSCALDESSYAWTWGTNISLGINKNPLLDTNGGCASPQSVAGGKKFRLIGGIQGSFAGSGAFIGLDESSYAWAWGHNGYGYVGDNTVASRSSPTSVVGGRQFKDVIGGLESFIAIDSSNYAWAWGKNPFGECGDNSISMRSSPVSVLGSVQWKKIVGHWGGFSGIDISSKLWSWGSYSPQGTVGDNVSVSSPIQIYPKMDWLDIYSSGSSCGVIALDGSSEQWGWGYFFGKGTLNIQYTPVPLIKQFDIVKAVGSYTQRNNIYLTTTGEVYTCSSYPYSTGILDSGPSQNPFSNYFYKTGVNQKVDSNMWGSNIQLGLSHATGAVIDKSSYLWTWGDPNLGGTYVGATCGSAKTYPTPMNISYLVDKKFTSIDGGGSSFIAIDENGVAWSWGANVGLNNNYVLGDGTAVNKSSPVMVLGEPNRSDPLNSKRWKSIKLSKPVYSVNTFYVNAVGIDSNDMIFWWGYWQTGALPRPTSLAGGKFWKSVDPGLRVNAAIDSSGNAWCWGDPTYGSLGNNATSVGLQSSPVAVVGGKIYTKISVGSSTQGQLGASREHVLALDQSSYIWSWGFNGDSQLGDGTNLNRSIPVSVIGDRKYIDIFAIGNGLSFALDASSYLYYWGTANASPRSVPGAKQWRYLKKGAACLMGIPSDSSDLWALGNDAANGLFYFAYPGAITTSPVKIYNSALFKAPTPFFKI